MRRSLRSGFTLIEILIVVGIIGVLVVVLLAVLLTASKKGEIAQAEFFVNNAVPQAMQKWQNDNGKDSNTFPASPDLTDGDSYSRGNIELFNELVTKPIKAGKEAYIGNDLYVEGSEGGRPVFLDPWNRFYIYRNYTMKKSASGKNRGYTGRRYNENSYDIISLGPDQQLYEKDGETDDIYNGTTK
ncbi:MAG: prepilin-type N-terminal cleavage/methylation domain-containing protein [Planctomycetes bacterium]|nr:prepilin-type N-terminal cleavage/methylation domain-containing protein [Planctomycetota bacterium]